MSRHRHPVRWLLAVLALTAGCATGGGQQAHAPLPACAQVLLIGVRGSGETPALGPTLTDLYRRLAAGHPTLHTAAYGLPYAARTTGEGTVAEASTRLAALVPQRHRQCPNEHLVLAGYSLGAEILGDALQRPDLATTPPAFAAATVLADTRFNPADTATAAGTFNPHYRGDRPRRAYAVPLAGRIRSYCRSHDPICQVGDPAADKAQHADYAPEQSCEALSFIEGNLGIAQTCGPGH